MNALNLGNEGCIATYLSHASSSADHVPLAIRSECMNAINDLMLGVPAPLVERSQNHAMAQAMDAVGGLSFDMADAHRGDLGAFSTQVADISAQDVGRGV